MGFSLMGAGAVGGHSIDSETSRSNSCSETSHVTRLNQIKQHSTQTIFATNSQMKMSCEICSVNFSFFKRKKFCQECRRYFCSSCLPKPPSNSLIGRQCSKCKLLMSGHFSRDDLQTWKVKDMTCFLNARNISTKDCREKHDLIELVLAQFCRQPRHSLQDQEEHENLVKRMAAHVQNVSTTNEIESPSAPSMLHLNPNTLSETQSTQNGRDGMFEISAERLEELLRESVERIREVLGRPDESVQEEDQPAAITRRMQIDDISTVSDIEDLSIRQLKELLVNNFVDYRGCCEKPELIERVKRLWKDHQANKAKAERIHREEEQAYFGEGQASQSVSNNVEHFPLQSTEASQLSLEIPSLDSVGDATTNTDSTLASRNTENVAATNKQLDDSLCHICMDSLVDCILLECGHMVTCTQCGKRLADCPICRQYIVRVVRVFRS